jgi:hypothetical protein
MRRHLVISRDAGAGNRRTDHRAIGRAPGPISNRFCRIVGLTAGIFMPSGTRRP